MGFTRSTTDIKVHQKLGDYPNQDDGLTPEELKKRYDYPAETIQKDLNNLEVELEKETASTNLGASSLDENDISNANVQDKLNKIYTEFKDVRDGGVKDGSLVTSKIQDGAITNSKIQDGAINTTKIEDLSITTSKIANSNVTTNKIEDGAVTGEKIDVNVKKAVNITAEKMNANDTSDGNVQAKINKIYDDLVGITQGSVADNSITTSKIVNGAVTGEKITNGYGLVPKGLICMWSGSTVPSGWYLCDGTNGTPDLRNRFIVGSGDEYSVGTTGGNKTVILTTAQMPAHTHTGTTEEVTVTKEYTTVATTPTSSGKEQYPCLGASGTGSGYDGSYPIDMGTHSHSFTTDSTGSGQAHENRPPYYALAFIMKG